MNKFIGISLIIFLSQVLSVEAQRTRTLEDIVYGTTYETAMNVCKNRAGGNVLIAKDRSIGSYYCYFDTNIAKAEEQYQQNKRDQQEQQQQASSSTFRRRR